MYLIVKFGVFVDDGVVGDVFVDGIIGVNLYLVFDDDLAIGVLWLIVSFCFFKVEGI